MRDTNKTQFPQAAMSYLEPVLNSIVTMFSIFAAFKGIPLHETQEQLTRLWLWLYVGPFCGSILVRRPQSYFPNGGLKGASHPRKVQNHENLQRCALFARPPFSGQPFLPTPTFLVFTAVSGGTKLAGAAGARISGCPG